MVSLNTCNGLCVVCAVESAKRTPVTYFWDEPSQTYGQPICSECQGKGRILSGWVISSDGIVGEAEIWERGGDQLFCEFSGATINHWHDCMLNNPLVLNGYFKKAPLLLK
jgi:hypothetical protein